MDRFNINQTDVDQARASELASVANGDDDFLTDRIDATGAPTTDESGTLVDRRDREHVVYYQDAQGLWKPSALKRDDDVLLWGCIPGRVVGPSRYRDWAIVWYVLSEESYDQFAATAQIADVFDRAPADPNETAMPIVPSEPQPEMMAAAARATAPTEVAKPANKGQSKQDLRELVESRTTHLTDEQQKQVMQAVQKLSKAAP